MGDYIRFAVPCQFGSVRVVQVGRQITDVEFLDPEYGWRPIRFEQISKAEFDEIGGDEP